MGDTALRDDAPHKPVYFRIPWETDLPNGIVSYTTNTTVQSFLGAFVPSLALSSTPADRFMYTATVKAVLAISPPPSRPTRLVHSMNAETQLPATLCFPSVVAHPSPFDLRSASGRSQSAIWCVGGSSNSTSFTFCAASSQQV